MTPDFSRGFLRIPLAVWLSVYCRGALTRRQLQLVSVVIRESWGWRSGDGSVHTWTRPLSSRQLAEATGLAIDHLRRDLQVLIDRGVLRERAGRYQFTSSPALWITTAGESPNVREAAPEWSDATAEEALSNLASKKEQRKQRNVNPPSEGDLSPGGGNSSSPSSLARLQSQSKEAGRRDTVAGRLADVVAAFVGSLSAEEADALRHWADKASVAAVWSALEPAFRLGPVVARQRLRVALAKRVGEL